MPSSDEPGRLKQVPTDALFAELAFRRAMLRRLEIRRATLVERIRLLDREIREVEVQLGLAGPRAQMGGGSRRRRLNSRSLSEALEEALKGRQLGIPEAAAAVLDAGYVSKAVDFYGAVAQKLTTSERFRRVRRGVYTAR